MAKNSNPTQCGRILEYLHRHGTITQYEALLDLGIMRLASRMTELKKRGHKIETEWVKVSNRYGETCRVKRYRLMNTKEGGG